MHASIAAVIFMASALALAADRAPVVHLSFDSDFQDKGPFGFAVTNCGDQLSLNRGVKGYGLLIGGTEDWLDVAVDARLCLTNGATLELWFSRDDWENPYKGGSGWQTVAHIDGMTINITAPGCPSHTPWQLEASAGWRFGATTNVKPIKLSCTDRTIKPTTWWHVAIVHDPSANQTILYADGKPVARSTSAPPLASTFVNPLRIGTWFKANQAFRGLVDEVKIYDYPRSAEQISGTATR